MSSTGTDDESGTSLVEVCELPETGLKYERFGLIDTDTGEILEGEERLDHLSKAERTDPDHLKNRFSGPYKVAQTVYDTEDSDIQSATND